jgi:two-component system, OmpR family, response regulator
MLAIARVVDALCAWIRAISDTRSGAPENFTGSDAALMHVLCVEDDRVNRLLLEVVLQQIDGLTIDCAESGAEAVTLVTGQAPDLLVVDLHLPDTDGLALLPRLRQATGQPCMPAILCTAELPADVLARATEAGFFQIWSKPVTVEQVHATLNSLSLPGPAAAP